MKMSINLRKIFLKTVVNHKKNNYRYRRQPKIEETPDNLTRLDGGNVKYEET
jgi:hypothetical protein